MEMLISFSSRNLAPAHTANTTSKWFAGHDVTVLDRPANIPGIWNIVICDIFHMESMGYFGINGIFSREMRKSIQQSRRAEGSIVPQQCHRLIASMPHLTDAGACAKEPPAKY